MFGQIITLGRTWTIGELAILIIIIGAVCAVVAIALKKFGWSPPDWLVNIIIVLIVAFVAILAIRILLSM